MIESNVASAIAYYKAMNNKDVASMGRHLHPDVQLVSPMEHLTGKDAVLEAATRLSNHIQGIKMHARFGSEEQAMVSYDMNFAEPIGVCRAAALMTFKDSLIARNEVFFDTRPFKKKDDKKGNKK